MNRICKKIRKYVFLTISLILVFITLLLSSFVFDDNKIKDNVLKSINNYDFYENEKLNYKIDNYTDMIILNIATYKNDNSILKKIFENEYGVLYVEKYGNEEIYWNMYENLKSSLENKNDGSVYYGRFWHGYLFFVKGLLTICTYQQSLTILFILGILLILLSCYLLLKKINWQSMLIYIISLWSLGILVFSSCYQYYFTFMLMIISVIFLLIKYHDKFDYKLYFFVIGAISSYLLYISFPLITLIFPLIIILLIKGKNAAIINYKENIKLVFLSSLFWLIGYVTLFSSKWIIGTVFGGHNFITNALISINQRLGITFPFNVLDVLKLNFMEFFSHIENIIFVIISLVLLFIKLRRNFINKLKIISPFIFVLILPFIWIIFTTNHSAIHYWMIYRYFSIIVLSILSASLILSNKKIKYNLVSKMNLNDWIILISFLLFFVFFDLKIVSIICIVIIFIIFFKKINRYTKSFLIFLIIGNLCLLFINFSHKNLIDYPFYKDLYKEVYNKVMYYGEQYVQKNNLDNGKKVDIKDLIDELNSDSVFLLGCDGYIVNNNGTILPYLNCNGVTITQE